MTCWFLAQDSKSLQGLLVNDFTTSLRTLCLRKGAIFCCASTSASKTCKFRYDVCWHVHVCLVCVASCTGSRLSLFVLHFCNKHLVSKLHGIILFLQLQSSFSLLMLLLVNDVLVFGPVTKLPETGFLQQRALVDDHSRAARQSKRNATSSILQDSPCLQNRPSLWHSSSAPAWYSKTPSCAATEQTIAVEEQKAARC